MIRVKYKDSISYRNPAKFPRSSAQVNHMMYQKQQRLLHHKQQQQSQQTQQQSHQVQQQQQQVTSNGTGGVHNTGEQNTSVPGQDDAAAGTGAASSSASIPAIKKILRAIRTLTNKSGDPSAGASVQQVISLIGQRELGMPPSFVSRVLKAGVIQGQCVRCANFDPLLTLFRFFLLLLFPLI